MTRTATARPTTMGAMKKLVGRNDAVATKKIARLHGHQMHGPLQDAAIGMMRRAGCRVFFLHFMALPADQASPRTISILILPQWTGDR